MRSVDLNFVHQSFERLVTCLHFPDILKVDAEDLMKRIAPDPLKTQRRVLSPLLSSSEREEFYSLLEQVHEKLKKLSPEELKQYQVPDVSEDQLKEILDGENNRVAEIQDDTQTTQKVERKQQP